MAARKGAPKRTAKRPKKRARKTAELTPLSLPRADLLNAIRYLEALEKDVQDAVKPGGVATAAVADANLGLSLVAGEASKSAVAAPGDAVFGRASCARAVNMDPAPQPPTLVLQRDELRGAVHYVRKIATNIWELARLGK